MTVTVQSSNLSSLSPKLQVYSSSLAWSGRPAQPRRWEQLSASARACNPAKGITSRFWQPAGHGPIGGYGLLVKFGSGSQSPIAPPSTMVPEQPDGSGGTSNDNAPTSSDGGLDSLLGFLSLGNLSGWLDGYLAVPGPIGNIVTAVTTQISDAVDALEVVAISIAGSSSFTQDTGISQLLSGNMPTASATSRGRACAGHIASDRRDDQSRRFDRRDYLVS